MPRIYDHSYTPVRFLKKKMPWENTLFMGLELELEDGIEMDDDYFDMEDAMNPLTKFLKRIKKQNLIYFKDECSIDGVEIVTHPLTLQYIHNKMQFHKLLDVIKKKTPLRENNQCGIHVHLSKDFFTGLELHKLNIFFTVNKVQINRFSQREPEKTDVWSPANNFTIENFLHSSRKFDKHPYSSEGGRTRYNACVLESNLRNTIELRCFAATTDSKRLTAIFQFCDAIAYFVRDISIKAISEKRSWDLFMEWCYRQNRYNHFLQNFAKCRTKKCRTKR